ncbi:MAG TPA: multicopper oxidase domain-containing protein [Candidatus Sulfotelmatobacter sp.]|nr:multicopper oxidase domain-containing protein [Candidatus Sulfotelmatobacter sp.]
MRHRFQVRLPIFVVLVCFVAVCASAQSFRVQCPSTTITHPAGVNDSEPVYTGATSYKCSVAGGCVPGNNVGYLVPSGTANGAIKCQQISGGDGYSTMGDGTQTYMFSFGPLSGLSDIAAGLPGTEPPSVFNTPYPGATKLMPGDPATTDDSAGNPSAFSWNGAVGLVGDSELTVPTPHGVTARGTAVVAGGIIEDVTINNGGSGYLGPVSVTFGPPNCTPSPSCATAIGIVSVTNGKVSGVTVTFAGEGYTNTPSVTFSAPVTGCTGNNSPGCIDGHVDPRPIMDVGVMNGNIPAPLMAIDEDDEFFLTLTNVGMIMRPDLFEQHTVHFHGYPNASTFYDGVPDASVAINIGASFTYYYLAPDAGTYFWHCHITPPEHLQMGMVGQLYVRPRQNRVPTTETLYAGLKAQQADLRTACNSANDILCSNPLPAGGDNGVKGGFVVPTTGTGTATKKFAYNDGDGSTAYDVEYPIQIHGFDPNFHFVGMTFNPEGFADMKDKYFLLNGRSYPDTVTAGPLETISSDGAKHFSQPLPSIINIPSGKRALLRISDLDVTEYQTLASLGIPMTVIGYNAKLLRDQAGNNMYYKTNSITLGGGESLDVILDASDTTKYPSGSVFYLYTPNLDHLSNDAENFGGLMTEVRIN